VVIEPEDVGIAPPITSTRNERLVGAGNDFDLEILIENASTCDWPLNGDLELTFVSNTSTLLEEGFYDSLNNNCPEDASRTTYDVNFTSPQRPRFFITQRVRRGEQTMVEFAAEAPRTRGCYFSAWQLQFAAPEFDEPILVGDPIVIAIQVFGGN
jgi:hypothetical protein